MALLKLKHSDGTWGEIPTIVGSRGKSAYQYAVDGGFTGTEAEFSEKVAEMAGYNTENWTFTLDDGSTITRAVYMGIASNTELWTFTLEDGSIVTKEVRIG